MSEYDLGLRRIAQYRLCLERDGRGGIVAVGTVEPVDRCLAALAELLESARVAVEGAGAGGSAQEGFAREVVAACVELARRLFLDTYQEADARRLAAVAEDRQARAHALVEQLRARLDRAA